MTSYTDRFGSTSVSASDETYQSITTGTNFSFVWPAQYANTGTVLTDITELTATASGLVLSMPPANQSSTGKSAVFKNVGGTALTLGDNNGATITTIGTTQAFQLYVKDNSSAGGTWGATQMGSGAASANAGALAGPGIQASGAVLEIAIGYRPMGAGGFGTLYATDLGTFVDWTSGAGTLTLLGGTLYGTNFITYFRNSGSGAVTTIGNNIDNAAPSVFQPNDGCTIVCDGTSLHTVGRVGSVAATLAGNGLQAIGNVLQVKAGGWPVSVTGTGVAVTQPLDTTTNADNAFSLSVTGFDGTYATGQVVSFIAGNPNTGTLATTLNINAISAGTVYKATPAGTAVLGTGDWQAGQKVSVVQDGTNWFQLSGIPHVYTALGAVNAAGLQNAIFAQGLFTSAYNQYDVRFDNVAMSAAGAAIYVRIAEDANGTTFKSGASDYQFATSGYVSSGQTQNNSSTSAGASQIALTPNIGATTSTQVCSGVITITNPSIVGVLKPVRAEVTGNGTLAGTSAASLGIFSTAGAYVTDGNAITGIDILVSTGTYITGNFVLYGVKKY